MPPDTSVLEAVEAVEEAGAKVPTSCRGGICETDVLDGIVDHRDSVLTSGEQAAQTR
ncbi:2Fe-2S iron-sulfur cluster-binding protein [Streptomyces sp. NPDC048156]|uniref:2Fe-2S iron-sulfur cluster-binding protein n=1 Tax=Streptomyces sp. NPDC048156 TaxID=3365502 RepID=UPI00372434BE